MNSSGDEQSGVAFVFPAYAAGSDSQFNTCGFLMFHKVPLDESRVDFCRLEVGML